MNVLLTGAFGNIGRLVIDALQDNHLITAFDLKTPTNVKVSKEYQDVVNVVWGDINDESILRSCVAEQDAIIHLAAVLPPFTEIKPELAYRVNVEGTRQLLNIANKQKKKPLFLFASSFAVFGHQQDTPPPRTVSDPLDITDNYSHHKIECEAMIQEQAFAWAILRLGACLDGKHLNADKESMQMAVNTRADNRIEFVYPVDVATAIKHAVERKEAHNKIHLIGGGEACQITHMEMLNIMLGAAGMSFNVEDFGEQAFYTDWMDTRESQRILAFQNHGLNDLKAEVYEELKYARWVVRPISPIVKAIFMRWLGKPLTRLSVKTSIEVAADKESIWSKLTDLKSYSDWNSRTSFNRSPIKRKVQKMRVRIYGIWLSVPVRVNACSIEDSLSWTGGMPGLFTGHHYFKVMTSENDATTKIIQGENFRGLLVPIVFPLIRSELHRLYDEMNWDLKTASE